MQSRQKRKVPAALAGAPGTASAEQVKALDDKVNALAEAQKKSILSEFNPAIGLAPIDAPRSPRPSGSAPA